MRSWFHLLVALIAIGHFASPGHAQMLPGSDAEPVEEVVLPDPLTPEAVQALVARLSDAEVRTLLLERLDAAAAAQATQFDQDSRAEQLAGFFVHATTGVYTSVATAVQRVPLLWDHQIVAFENFGDRFGVDGLTTLFGSLAVGFLLGLVVEHAVVRLLRGSQERALARHRPDTLKGALSFLGTRLFYDLVGLVVFFIIARAVGFALITEEMRPFAILFMANLVMLPRLIGVFTRFLLAPQRPEYRIVHTDDRSAWFLHRHQIGLFALIGAQYTLLQFNTMNGVPLGEMRIGFWLNLLVHLYLIFVAWRARAGLTLMMRGPDPNVTRMEQWVARAYPYFAIVLSVVTWLLVEILASYQLFELLSQAPHYKMMVLLLMAPSLDTLVRGLVRQLTPPMTGEGELAERAHHATKRAYIRIGRVVCFGIVVFLIADIWGLDFSNLAASGFGAAAAARLIEILMILATGYLVWEFVSLIINRILAAEQTKGGAAVEEEMGAGEGGGAGGSRLSTVLPLIRGILRVVVAVIFVLIALGNLGIDITPLLAGAGIIGLAIGFGAQKLVADVVSGIFFLVDDAFRTGEFVDIEGTMGTVERISIRSMQLRHHLGAVHTLPYGEIPKITNYSRDWVIMKLKFTVPFETDPNKVKKIFKRIGQEMLAVPEYASDMIEPFKSQGVFDFNDVGMVIRGKFMAKPGKQFVLRKEIYNRVKQAFADNGIEFARREVHVAIPGLESQSLTEEQQSAVAGAATEAAQAAIRAETPPTPDADSR